jgi:hypothetical protein
MSDKVEVDVNERLGWKKALQEDVSRRFANILGTQTQTPGDPEDMGIDGKGGLAEGKEHDDGCRLRAYPLKLEQPFPGIFGRKFAQELEIDRAAFRGDLA